MTNTKISVVVPVYNAAKYLNATIDSITGQTYRNLEIILVNDGSTDESLQICAKHAKADSRIIVVDGTNGGVSKARNRGIAKASGEYITFVDADDTIDSGMYAHFADCVEKYRPDLLECGMKRLRNDGSFISNVRKEFPGGGYWA